MKKSFWISLTVFSAIVLGYILWSVSETDRHYIYILDDAYIHLAIAKNFALYKVWGITQYQFSSTSSSPAFTFLLSFLIFIFGNHELIPLVFNALIGICCVYFLNRYYAEIFSKTGQIVAAVLFTLLYSVFHMQILSGMEHPLQVFLVIINMMNLRNWYLSDFKDKNAAYWFYFTITLLGLVRFESMFYFTALAFCFLILKKYRLIAPTLLFGFVPIAIFAYFNYQESGYFFPNSVLVKGTRVHSGDIGGQLYNYIFNKILLNVTFYKLVFFPLLLTGYVFWKDYRNSHSFINTFRKNFLLILWILTMLQHSIFADLKGYFRYEAYFMVGFTMAAIPRLKEFLINFRVHLKQDYLLSFLVLMNIVLMFYKTGFANYILKYGSKNIYEQQIQSAKFLHQYYNTSKVIANDIGAISCFTDIHLLDIVALGSAEMIPFNEQGREFNEDFKNFLTEYGKKNQYDIAVVYDRWLDGQIPETWNKAADLYISPVVSVAIDKVSIYSVNPEHYSQLIQNIQHFNWNKNVRVEIVKP